MAPYILPIVLRGLPLPKFGDGTTARDYTFIDDIVSGVVSALDCFLSRMVCLILEILR